MSFQKVIAKKIKLNGLGGIRHHMLDRDKVKTNPDIDLTRSNMNFCFENLTPEHLESRVHARIKQLHLKKHPRSDAVGLEDIVISASADFILNIDTQTRQNYFLDSLHFLQNRYGKENVMYCQCHLDESSPHIHVGIVPITSDGRLSAKSLFTPKTLEKLQTDFHNAVSSHYGLERGELHSKKYLPIQKFKAQQAKLKAEQFTHDLQTVDITHDKINEVNKTAHYKTTGVIFTSKDRENVELPTDNFIFLRRAAEDGATAVAKLHLLQDKLKELQHNLDQANSDADFFKRQLNELQEETQKYTAVPSDWRNNVDSSINIWQKTATSYFHDLNRATIRVFIATHGNLDKTCKIMNPLYEKYTNIPYIRRYISDVIKSAKIQFKTGYTPSVNLPSWNAPKPNDTDYKKPDETGIVPLQLSNVPDVNWEVINWNLLSELDKDDILHKKIYREL